MRRVGNVTLNVFCDDCDTTQEVVFTNEEWEDSFWLDMDRRPLTEVRCPNCGHCEDVSIY